MRVSETFNANRLDAKLFQGFFNLHRDCLDLLNVLCRAEYKIISNCGEFGQFENKYIRCLFFE